LSGRPGLFRRQGWRARCFRIGEFSNEPIAGVTPIEEMLEINARDMPAPVRVILPADNSSANSPNSERNHDKRTPRRRLCDSRLRQDSNYLTAYSKSSCVQRFF